MVVFLADRTNVRVRQLHRRVKNRFQSDGRFDTVRFRVSEPREPGPYRVVADVNPRQFLDDSSYPASDARLETGVQLSDRSKEYYWFNWIEPDRDFLLGWHRDDTHPGLGPVHVQVSQSGSAVAHRSAQFLDRHPMAVVEARLEQLPEALARVDWEDGTAVGIDY